MMLVTHTQINKRYFAAGSRPARKDWIGAIERGEINGKVGIDGRVYIDEDDFLRRDNFTAAPQDQDDIDLLAG